MVKSVAFTLQKLNYKLLASMLKLMATGLQDKNILLMKRKNTNKIASLICMKKGQLRKHLDDAGAKPLSDFSYFR